MGGGLAGPGPFGALAPPRAGRIAGRAPTGAEPAPLEGGRGQGVPGALSLSSGGAKSLGLGEGGKAFLSQPTSAPPPNSRTVLRRVASLSHRLPPLLISCVSYLYVVKLMSNSCGAGGRGVNRSQSLWISLPITHLAPVAISPRALWWRRPPRRPLGAGALGFFPGFECHLSVWPTNAPRSPPLARHSSASRVPELGRFTFAPCHPLHPSRRAPPSRTPPSPPLSIGRSSGLFPGYHFHSSLGPR